MSACFILAEKKPLTCCKYFCFYYIIFLLLGTVLLLCCLMRNSSSANVESITSHQTKLVKLFTGGNIIICLVYSISVCCAGLNSSAFTLPNLATLSANDKHTTSSSILERYILPKIYKITRVNWHKSHR
jgi:hypothetical protein